MTPIQAPVSPRTGWLSDLIILNERIRRDRIITLPSSEYEQIVPAHIAAAKLAEGTR
ncbi:hypothetical protein PARHAE_00724 [Paracoccus haematequi]|uniref:Uncharacterized protein n=1 Tax=Paracoccus haematequi TaxID=2491866 RepID=A0A3S4CH37_9RHOB|nr:hypothetical protein [Paracoccus haematequi]VDS07547.1 hypothetical protein PARHAE_00724 [Paracoccus haematequi]